ncbi:MAG: HD domain-containing protein [Acidobacteria bacterium]|nr:HD domain-containing protein [Acidobacteriota bacterium]
MTTPTIRLRPALATSQAPTISIAIGESKTVGRSAQADVMIDDPSLSRLHARVTLTDAGALRADDLASTNGMFVNGAQQSSATLSVGDRVRFGFVEYCVETMAPPAPPVAEPTMTRRPVEAEASISVDGAALAGLLATSRELMATTDLPGLLERVLDRLQPILKPDRSAILLFDAATGELTPRAVRPTGAYTSVSDFASATAVREAIRAREVLEVYDAALDSRLQDSASIARAGVRSALCVPLLGRTGPIGALYADRLMRAGRFTPVQSQIASAFAANAAAALETAQLYDDRERHFRATLETFAKAIDARDHYTAGHSERVTAYTLVLARTAGVEQDQLETIRRAGMLHDIGKVGVPDHILLKPGRLDDPERVLMEAHVTIGYDMLHGLPFLTDALPVIRGHHERWDGKGYPDRIGGTDIHAFSRLMSVADSYDAMTSARPYRKALPAEEAARRLRVDSGTQFDAHAIELFDVAEAEFDMIRQRANR